jgi:hypothetical protein
LPLQIAEKIPATFGPTLLQNPLLPKILPKIVAESSLPKIISAQDYVAAETQNTKS